MTRRRPIHSILLRLALLVVVALAALPAMSRTQIAHAATNMLHLRVESARSNANYYRPVPTINQGDQIMNYKFMINRDDTGDPTQDPADCFPATSPTYPADCQWPSVRVSPGGTAAGIVTQGDETILDDDTGNPSTGINLPDGNYLISVVADGFKIDGVHFTVPLEDPGLVVVQMLPYELPLATVRIKVFEDNTSVNSQWDELIETGLQGFEGHLSDIAAEVTTDWYGNPLCTEYELDINGRAILDVDGRPTPIPGTGGKCISDANGDIVIPNLGPNRYAVSVVPPNGQVWIQTTTLEGGHDWDEWVNEGYAGYDTEVIVGGEPTPNVPFGFVRPTDLLNGPATGGVTGVVVGVKAYVPPVGGLTFEGNAGAKLDEPINRPWVSLNDLRANDQAVYIGRGNPNGSFAITNVPDGDYLLTAWDQEQDFLLQSEQVTVSNGQVTNVGNILVAHWFSIVKGTVFIDSNANGKRDPGEQGLPNQTLVLKSRDNSLQDQGTALATTKPDGSYIFREAYPLGQWVVQEVYNDRFYTTGVTYQTDNQPEETTFLGAGVDVNTFNLVGLTSRVDWGVLPYAPGTNGGIVGTVTYDTTRNELDAHLAATEDFESGIPNIRVNLWAAAKNPDGSFVINADGSYANTGVLLNSALTETWERPINCTARNVNNDPVSFPWTPTNPDSDCLEAFPMGNQVQTDFATVNGNYGFGDGCFGAGGFDIGAEGCADSSAPTALPAGDYLVEVEIPNDDYGRPLFKLRKEEDVNVFDGDQFIPQVPPPACAGALHTVDVAGVAPDGPDAVDNPNFADAGGSPFEGQPMPFCNVKLVPLQDRRSIAPLFPLFTDVPIPGRFHGLVIDDLNISIDPKELFYGEKAGIPNLPVGLYDYTGRLVHTMQTDPNGVYDVILPSTGSINCPTPTGICPNVYRFVANDPGQPGRPNPNYNPQYRTIATNFQLWPGLTLPSDLAPTPIAVAVQGPGTQNTRQIECRLDVTTPQLFAVSRPYVRTTDTGAARQITLTGLGFGATQGSGQVTLDTTVLAINSWSDRTIVATVPTLSTGARQLRIRAGNGQSTINDLTFHVLGAVAGSGTPANPRLITVNPALAPSATNFQTIQAALENAAGGPATRRDLIVVFPGPASSFNPLGAYYENVVMHSPDKLQGVGPGGVYADNTAVRGSVIDGIGFNTVQGQAAAWRALVDGLTWSGNQNVYDAEVVYILAQDGQWSAANTNAYRPAIDGFTLQGGYQMDFPGNLNDVGGGPVPNPTEPQEVAITQGGGIYANAYARNLQITNNVLQSNGGTYGGAIRLGTSDIGDNQNDNIRIVSNRILANGGSNLAGSIAIFNGAENYEIANNDICGNFSAEYGGGISHFGLSPGGAIHDNRIYFNGSYDEGAGIMIAGELPATPNVVSPGSGSVSIYNNTIQSNLANDDGGGIRFLMAGNFPINAYNNIIVNNVSTHEGGGVAFDDATNVRFFNNTVMKNITTATAVTSNGQPAPAGLSDTGNSTLLQATLPGSHELFSDPLLFNNIFWDNRAGAWNSASGTVGQIGLPGDPAAINNWDMSVIGVPGALLEPTNSILQTTVGTVPSPSNQVGADPLVISSYNTVIAALPWRGDPSFIGTVTIAIEVPPTQLGNYHLQSTTSPAYNTGAASRGAGQAPSPVSAPTTDIDGDARPSTGGFEIGADEIGPATLPFPFTAVLDNFNRTAPVVGGSILLGNTWRGNNTAALYRILSNAAQVRSTGGYLFWCGVATAPCPNGPTPPAAGVFGSNQEAYFTFTQLSPIANVQSVFVKANGLSESGTGFTGANPHVIVAEYDPTISGGQVRITTYASGQNWVTRATFNGITFGAGDQLGIRALSDGTVIVFRNGTSIGSTNVTTGPTPWPAAFASGGGRIGVWFIKTIGSATGFAPPNDARFDNFGGGTLP